MLRCFPRDDRLGHIVLLLLIFSPLQSLAQDLALVDPEEDVLGAELFEKRPGRFSFGLGKRGGVKTKTISAEEFEKLLSSFDLLKTTTSPMVLKKLAMILKVWKGRGNQPTRPDTMNRNRVSELTSGNWGYTSPHGLFKRPSEDVDSSLAREIDSNIEDKFVKRASTYGFGLGKRDSIMGKRPAYSFGLGKRGGSPGSYSFGLGKRAQNYQFGLGKRANSYQFGLG